MLFTMSAVQPHLTCFHFSSSQARKWMKWWSEMLHCQLLWITHVAINTCAWPCTAQSEVNHCQPHFKWLISSDWTTPNYFGVESLTRRTTFAVPKSRIIRADGITDPSAACTLPHVRSFLKINFTQLTQAADITAHIPNRTNVMTSTALTGCQMGVCTFAF